MNSFSSAGKAKRLSRLLDGTSKRTVIVPIDDSLIFGPYDGLADLSLKIKQMAEAKPNGILAFAGVFREFSETLSGIGAIINLTASTVRSMHTRKVLINNLQSAIALDPEAVAVHVNVTSAYESEMLNNLGLVSRECESFGVPLMAIMYPRREEGDKDDNYDDLKKKSPEAYTRLVCHCTRIAADLGADLIKTQFTGTAPSFQKVIEACWPIPVVVAGGPLTDPKSMLKNAFAAIEGGAIGVSFGRNVFNRTDSRQIITALKQLVYCRLSVDDALALINLPLTHT